MCSKKKNRGKHFDDYILVFIINTKSFCYKVMSIESKSHKRKLTERYSHVELGNMSIISQIMGMGLAQISEC